MSRINNIRVKMFIIEGICTRILNGNLAGFLWRSESSLIAEIHRFSNRQRMIEGYFSG